MKHDDCACKLLHSSSAPPPAGGRRKLYEISGVVNRSRYEGAVANGSHTGVAAD